MKPHRMRMTHNLVLNYGLLEHMDVYRPTRANKTQLTRFHSDEYIDFLETVTPETVEEMTGGGVRCLTGEDCPAFEGVFEFCSISAGGSIGAAERLNRGTADVAINWAGGLHHAKKTEASGFCYVNDIVLGILELLRHHPRVLYIDIDIHHGDGVEEAFYSTDRVMTASFHKFGDYFPGTGDVKDTGIKAGKNYAVNVPLRDGISDEAYQDIFETVIQHIMDWYRPTAVVLQCGADSLAGDKLGCFNLSMAGHAACARFVKKFGLPTIVVGGGGYTTKNVARAWTNETAVMCGQELDENLPYNEYMEYFGPRYKLEVLQNNMDDYNSTEYLSNIKQRIIENLRSMPFAPSSQIRAVPGASVGQAIGSSTKGFVPDDDVDFELDSKIRDIVRARTAGDALSDDEEEPMDSEDDAADVGTAFGRSNRRKRQGGVSARTGKVSMGSTTGRTNGRQRGKQTIVSGYSNSLVDVNARLGSTGSSATGPRKKRSFFTASNLPPIMPLGALAANGTSGMEHIPVQTKAGNGKTSAIRGSAAVRIGDSSSRSRIGSPMSVA
ncbi:hypothetical protein FFLO_01687 [Filobasidium floriforme]|uniref:histone deacetylase n=2 Tax=Filobasidium floriforme TaxID=5210 RepID=A0A8K0JQK3_9TREE|nr:hypothetical protein FFLO_01687 [Filobasidium floriforme]